MRQREKCKQADCDSFRFDRATRLCWLHHRMRPSKRDKGDNVGYAAAHNRLYRDRGPASDYSCSCGKPASDWALDNKSKSVQIDSYSGKRFSLVQQDYSPMCNSCHQKMDKKWKREQ